MTEKQTFSSENQPLQATGEQPQTAPLATEDWADAALRIVNEPRPTEQVPNRTPANYQETQVVERTPAPAPAVRPAPERAPALAPERDLDQPDRMSLGKRVAVGAALTAALAGGAAALNATEGGSHNPEQGDLDTTVTSITLDEDARVRFDPYVGHTDVDDTLADVTDTQITIDTPDGVRVKTDTANGDWYGVEANQIPNFDGTKDADGIVWVNEQKASVEHTTPEENAQP